MSLKWFGKEVNKDLITAASIGVNQTMAEAVAYAKQNHGFTNRTTTAEKSIRITTPAKKAFFGNVFGIWGSATTSYFRYLEFGTKITRGRTSIRQRVQGSSTGLEKPAQNAAALPWNGGSYTPTLSPAAVIAYPKLAKRIKIALKDIRKGNNG